MDSSNVNSKSMLPDVMNYPSLLLCLIEDRNWIALSNPKTFQILAKSISECGEFTVMTILHACVRYDPPIQVLETMTKLYPRALYEEDSLGRTPLHIAAGSGARPSTIRFLTVKYPQACDVQDDDGRTPLHFACDTGCKLFEDDDSPPRGPPSLNTVKVLLRGSLASVTLEDINEMNAVEYAIMADAPMEVVRLLQKASQWIRVGRKR